MSEAIVLRWSVNGLPNLFVLIPIISFFMGLIEFVENENQWISILSFIAFVLVCVLEIKVKKVEKKNG